ncbi:Asparagine synthase (glutamine-hydrolyzing) [Thermoplasmatales archaeon BRNA1]|nr:Asparagine synthase (glutamine-hydrolyzing) [Thermoplasmatales archaeon BRNA1]
MAKYEELGRAIEESVRKASMGKEVAVAFSGGMDSGLVAALAKKYARSVTCYTCGTDDSFDVQAGRELAGKLELPWVHCRIGEDTIEGDIRELIQATKVSDPFTISYELQLFTVCRKAHEPVVLSGQGSDEYFGGCFNSVSDDDSAYEEFRAWGIERLMKVSVPCEISIAEHFGRRILYPYLDGSVLGEVGKIDPEELRPRSLGERKSVVKQVAEELGFPALAHRTKKASQYGSGTTELIGDAAKKEGVRYNRYIARIYEGLDLRNANLLRDAAVDIRMDPILLHDAEEILSRLGKSHSEAVAEFYAKLVKEGNTDFLK